MSDDGFAIRILTDNTVFKVEGDILTIIDNGVMLVFDALAEKQTIPLYQVL